MTENKNIHAETKDATDDLIKAAVAAAIAAVYASNASILAAQAAEFYGKSDEVKRAVNDAVEHARNVSSSAINTTKKIVDMTADSDDMSYSTPTTAGFYASAAAGLAAKAGIAATDAESAAKAARVKTDAESNSATTNRID